MALSAVSVTHAAVHAALASGRSVIVPTPQRAAALALAWARAQLAAGQSVWASPDILTWDAWLRREWQRANAREQVPPELYCLSPGQELLVWEDVLDELESGLESDAGARSLRQFAPELMRTAARVMQDDVRLAGAWATEEEALLLQSIARVRERSVRESFVALSLQPAPALQSVVHSAAPLFVGQQKLTALQRTLAETHWPGEQLLAMQSGAVAAAEYVSAASLEAEVQASAEWCNRLLTRDGSRRLLIVSALAEPRLPTLGNLLWRALSADTEQQVANQRDPALLAIEGGEPLLEHGLIADALDALQLAGDQLETRHLGRVLLSPYFGLGGEPARVKLELALRDLGPARWSTRDLQRALCALAPRHPMATLLADWLAGLARLRSSAAAPASSWAQVFSDSLAQCRFAAGPLDSRDAQRLERWHELLDDFASLDCVSGPMRCLSALDRLLALAARGMHSAASGDAAIVLTDYLGDPVANYDGIWVMGLSENRWPQPPRPNPFVPLAEQRRCGWPEAGVTQRLQQAQWVQSSWAARTPRLVLSYPEMEDDVHHRPSSLLPRADAAWTSAAAGAVLRYGLARAASDDGMPPVEQGADGQVLRNGVFLLRLQQECAFHAQAQLRLGAESLPAVSDGIDKRLRGTLLHRTLEALWREFADQARLAALDDQQRNAAFDRCWNQALLTVPRDGLPTDPGVMEREALRARRIVQRVLELESARAPFHVQALEQSVQASFGGWALNLRIDRVDELQDGRRLLIDYKTGGPERMLLHDPDARPIQLAAYVAALAAQGTRADAVALLSLSPRELGFKGRAADPASLPRGIRALEQWDTETRRWSEMIARLVTGHVQGIAAVAPLPGACDYCHLDSLCRITLQPGGPDEAEGIDE